jgi:putative ABC transport system substrate-binding protein
MKRRAVLAALAVPLASRASRGQQRMRRIGVLSPFALAMSADWHRALEAGLAQAGWTPGRNLEIEYRYSESVAERLPGLANELVRLGVDVIVSEVTEASWAAQKATSTIPIVMVAVGDPVAAGLVATLARPGGNVTGLSQNIVESSGKRMELLKLVVPDLREVAVLLNAGDENSALSWRKLRESAPGFHLSVRSFEARTVDELQPALARIADAGHSALFVVPGPLFVANLQTIAEFARAHRMASIFHLPEYVRLGGLMAHGPDRNDLFRRAAGYVDRILKGAKPADLPVEQPDKFSLSINRATARALGLTLPPLVLAQADEVIE